MVALNVPRELLNDLAFANFLLSRARLEVAHALGVQRTLALAAVLAHEQVQEKRIELLQPKETPLPQQIIEALILVALSAPAVVKAPREISRAAVSQLERAFKSEAAARGVQLHRLPLDPTLRPGALVPDEAALDPWRAVRDAAGQLLEHPGDVLSMQRAAQQLYEINDFAEAVAARVTLGEMTAYQDELADLPGLAEQLFRDEPPEDAAAAAAPDTWPTEVLMDQSTGKRLVAPGFSPSAGRSSVGVRLRQQAETMVLRLELGAQVLLAELDFTLEHARLAILGADPGAVGGMLEVANYAHPWFRKPSPPPPPPAPHAILASLISDLLGILPTYPMKQPPPGIVPLDALRDAHQHVFEKSLWMVLYGAELEEAPGRYDPRDPATDDRKLLGAPPELVRYWWARFPDPATRRPFPNQVLLFRHLKTFADGMSAAMAAVSERRSRLKER